MKKIYMIPCVKVYKVQTNVMLADSYDTISVTSEEGDNTKEVLSKDKKNNDWGNDWDDDMDNDWNMEY